MSSFSELNILTIKLFCILEGTLQHNVLLTTQLNTVNYVYMQYKLVDFAWKGSLGMIF